MGTFSSQPMPQEPENPRPPLPSSSILVRLKRENSTPGEMLPRTPRCKNNSPSPDDLLASQQLIREASLARVSTSQPEQDYLSPPSDDDDDDGVMDTPTRYLSSPAKRRKLDKRQGGGSSIVTPRFKHIHGDGKHKEKRGDSSKKKEKKRARESFQDEPPSTFVTDPMDDEPSYSGDSDGRAVQDFNDASTPVTSAQAPIDSDDQPPTASWTSVNGSWRGAPFAELANPQHTTSKATPEAKKKKNKRKRDEHDDKRGKAEPLAVKALQPGGTKSVANFPDSDVARQATNGTTSFDEEDVTMQDDEVRPVQANGGIESEEGHIRMSGSKPQPPRTSGFQEPELLSSSHLATKSDRKKKKEKKRKVNDKPNDHVDGEADPAESSPAKSPKKKKKKSKNTNLERMDVNQERSGDAQLKASEKNRYDDKSSAAFTAGPSAEAPIDTTPKKKKKKKKSKHDEVVHEETEAEPSYLAEDATSSGKKKKPNNALVALVDTEQEPPPSAQEAKSQKKKLKDQMLTQEETKAGSASPAKEATRKKKKKSKNGSSALVEAEPASSSRTRPKDETGPSVLMSNHQKSKVTRKESFKESEDDSETEKPGKLDTEFRTAGPFSKTEKEVIDKAIQKYAKQNSLSTSQIIELVQASAKSKESAELWELLKEKLPKRLRPAIVKYCKRKYTACDLKGGKWTAEEDQRLRELYALTPNKWREISGVMGRRPDDCRDRWRNYAQYDDSQRLFSYWTEDETKRLKDIIGEKLEELLKDHKRETGNPENYEPRDLQERLNWDAVATAFGGTRSRLQCCQKWKQIVNTEGKESNRRHAPPKPAITQHEESVSRGAKRDSPSKQFKSAERIENSDDEKEKASKSSKNSSGKQKHGSQETSQPKKSKKQNSQKKIGSGKELAEGAKPSQTPRDARSNGASEDVILTSGSVDVTSRKKDTVSSERSASKMGVSANTSAKGKVAIRGPVSDSEESIHISSDSSSDDE